MRRCLPRVAMCVGVGIGCLFFSSAAALAQTPAPSQVTPPSLRPAIGLYEPTIVLPGPAAIAPPAGDNGLTVTIGSVALEDAFPELSSATAPLLAKLRGAHLSVAQIYAAAAAVERLYADGGYPLARVVVPPQRLVDGGALRLAVIDGFIEAIDVDGVPAAVRVAVARRTAALIGRRHLKIGQIERALLVAGNLPGLRLRSTLARGEREGGVRLILDGEHRLVSASTSVDDRLAATLGTWQLSGTTALNGAFGLGEQLYGTLGLSAELDAAVAGAAPFNMYGGGAVVPIGLDGLTVNPEYTHSITREPASASAPASLGTFERFALRLRDPVSLTRQGSLNANVSLEQIDQQLAAPDFAATLNHDHYRVLRFGPDYATTLPQGTGVQIGALFSGGLGGRDSADSAASGIPLSRLGAGPYFEKLSGTVRIAQPLANDFRLDLNAAGQFTGGKPMLLPEQIALDGSDALSAFASGTFTADQGVTLRSELSRPFPVAFNAVSTVAAPYIFGAAGRGWLATATSVEQAAFNAEALGVGIRGSVATAANRPGASLALEVARGFTDLAGVRQGWRANVLASAAF